MTAAVDLEDRARDVLGRALDVVVVEPAPQPFVPRAGVDVGVARPPRPTWVWAGAVGAVAVLVAVAVVLVMPDRSRDVVFAAGTSPCGAVRDVPLPPGVVASGVLADGGEWTTEVYGQSPGPEPVEPDDPGADDDAVGMYPVAPGRSYIDGPGSIQSRYSWQEVLRGQYRYDMTPVTGGFVIVTELAPASDRLVVVWPDGSSVSACARAIVGVDGARYAGAFIPRGSPEPPELRSYTVDGTLLDAVDVDLPKRAWAEGAFGTSSPWTSPDVDPDAPTTTVPVVGNLPPLPPGTPCPVVPPPFRIDAVPIGIDPTPILYRDWRAANTPPGHEQAPELYDPVYTLIDPNDPDRRIELYNGNAWRLQTVVREVLQVFGHDAWLASAPDGTDVLHFQVDGTGSQCDYWALGGASGVTDEELLTAAESLGLDG